MAKKRTAKKATAKKAATKKAATKKAATKKAATEEGRRQEGSREERHTEEGNREERHTEKDNSAKIRRTEARGSSEGGLYRGLCPEFDVDGCGPGGPAWPDDQLRGIRPLDDNRPDHRGIQGRNDPL